MKLSDKTFHEIAVRCSKYSPKSGVSPYKNSTSTSETPSCLNCSHLTETQHCDLDLIDPIEKNLKKEGK